MTSLVTTARAAIQDVYRGTGGMASGGTYGEKLANRAAEVVVGAVLAAQREQVETLRRERPEWGSHQTVGVARYNDALDDVLALLAVVENDK